MIEDYKLFEPGDALPAAKSMLRRASGTIIQTIDNVFALPLILR